MDRVEIEKKRDDCLQFLESVLKPELKYALSREESVKQEIQDYQDLGNKLKKANKIDIHQDVDLGHNLVRCRAQIADKERIFTHVGMGIHVEMSLSEAIAFTDKRVSFLIDEVLHQRSIETTKRRQHIRASEMILEGLAAELSS